MKKIIFLIVGIAIFASCNNEIKISGEEAANEFPENFSGIAVQDGFDVIIENGMESKFKIETDKNIIPHVKYEIKNGILYFFKDRNVNFPSNAQVKIFVATNSLDVLKASNAKIDAYDTLKAENLDINISNSGSLRGCVECGQLRMTINDSKVKLDGTAENTLMNIVGVSFADLSTFETINAQLNMAGGCVACVKTIVEELEIYARDRSCFYYDVVGVFRSVILDDESKIINGTITLN